MGRFSKGAGRVALTAMLTALSLVFLYGASAAPSGRLGLIAAAGLFPAAAVVSGGRPAGFLCYAATGILALVLIPDKGGVLLYLVFFGIYPLIKHLIEKLKKLPLEWLCKMVLCNVVLRMMLQSSHFATDCAGSQKHGRLFSAFRRSRAPAVVREAAVNARKPRIGAA